MTAKETTIDIEEPKIELINPLNSSEVKKKKKEKKKKSNKLEQNNPPDIPIEQLFPSKDWPSGELWDYEQDFNTYRKSDTEKKNLEKVFSKYYSEARKGAEVHRQVRNYIQNWIQPGMLMIDIVEELEKRSRLLTEAQGFKQGIAFPTGCSLNHCAAHWTPNPGDTTVLQKEDVVKIDFGIHFNGRIIDSAFTMCFEDQYKPLLEAVKLSTYTGIKTAGIDVRLCDVGAAVQEVMESHEVEINKKIYDIKVITGLCGHSIEPYNLHAGKSVPSYDNKDQTKMEECEFYAIETFGSTGTGTIRDDVDCSHYMKEFNGPKVNLKSPSAKKLLNLIDKEFGTLAFCRRYLTRIGEDNHVLALHSLVQAGIVNDYPPLVDKKGSFTAQFEHTFVLKPTCKEILTKGEDY